MVQEEEFNEVDEIIEELVNFYPELWEQNGDRLEDWKIFLEMLPVYEDKEDNDRVEMFLKDIEDIYKKRGYLQ